MLHFSKFKIAMISVICFVGFMLALPNLVPENVRASLPEFMQKPVTLGLDLQGGAHLLYRMEEGELVADWVEDIGSQVRDTLRRQRIGYADLRADAGQRRVTVTVRDPAQGEAALNALKEIASPLTGNVFTGATGSNIDVTRDGDVITLAINDAGLTQRVNHAIEASIETVRRRVDAFGTTEPTILRQGRDRILVQVPGIDDVARLKALVGETGKLEFKMVDSQANAQEVAQSRRAPPGSELLMSTDTPPQPYVIRQATLVSGDSLTDAQPSFDSRTNEPVVTFRFDSAGARRFGRVTQDNVGLPFAIILDGKVISAPVIREPILGGSGQISGNFTVQEANDLSVLLRSGALPAKLTPIEERTVGPSLGADSIEAGLVAGAIGSVLTLIICVAIYGLFGAFAAAALIINGFIILGVMTALGATLTLPGIAGIVLTIGMAIDANVLIFERIKEELRTGKTTISAIDAGFNRAILTIADSQLTTLAAAIIMFWLGSGPIRGFAVTLSIGVATSVFTAVTVTRMIVALWVKSAARKSRLVEAPL
jgi:protein-export membrane protein SecD